MKKVILRLLLSILVVIIILGILYFICYKLGYTNMNKETLREMIEKTGAWGPLIFILISFLQVTFIPIPGAVTILAGNLLFGPLLAIIYSFIGMFLGALLAFALGRWLGRPFVNWIMGDKETVDKYLERIKSKETVILFFMFLLPFFPDDALCSLAGITALSWPVFTVMQIITRLVSISGTILFMSGEIIPYHGWGLVVIIGIAIISIICFIIAMKKADKINAFLEKRGKKKD